MGDFNQLPNGENTPLINKYQVYLCVAWRGVLRTCSKQAVNTDGDYNSQGTKGRMI